MRVIPIQSVPNQTFSVTVDNIRFIISLKETRGVMAADISRNGETILRGSRVLAGEAIIPYRYLEDGNFFVLTDTDTLPDWRLFSVSQQMIYLNAEEMAAARV